MWTKTTIGALRTGDVFSRWGRLLILEPRDRNGVQRAALLHKAHYGEMVVLTVGGTPLAYDHETDGVLKMAVRDPGMQVLSLRLRRREPFDDPQPIGGPLPATLFKPLPVTDGFFEMPYHSYPAPVGELHALWLRGNLRTPRSVALAATLLGVSTDIVRDAVREWEAEGNEMLGRAQVGHG